MLYLLLNYYNHNSVCLYNYFLFLSILKFYYFTIIAFKKMKREEKQFTDHSSHSLNQFL